ncbi:hypothetical protein [Clostridium cellulovorans]|uniref:Uncharacterized protein n=1 Tax=Clostridium cellulovorans (strain ATCC 35296 / DSM 3052 / OCM 3 / 743B) TaxID=573061 RepID=D9SVQ7_CLOC7|nr:hypothetical protein [Clostridium cellulovorans]ADL53118.1 hypothetical protein Clocel_3440 [Clostridium cellulovorans 743B]
MDKQIKESMKNNLEKHQVSQTLRARTKKSILEIDKLEKESRGFIRDRLNLKIARYISIACVLGLVIVLGAKLTNHKELDKLFAIDSSVSDEEKRTKEDQQSVNEIADGKTDNEAKGNTIDANSTLNRETEGKGDELANEVGSIGEAEDGGSGDDLSINYSSLRFTETEPIETPKNTILNYSTSRDAKVVGFAEEFLKDSVLVFKGTVTNIYFKNYQFEVYTEESKENETVPAQAEMVVYEVKIDDIIYSEEDVKVGDIIKIEEYNSGEEFGDERFGSGLKVNHQYIIPVDEAGETIIYKGSNGHLPTGGYYARGNITRDGKYTTLCYFAPQIEVTLDNQYLFHDRWTSLINSRTKNVVVDPPKSSWYNMKLRDDDDFIKDLKNLIEKYK